MNPEFADKLQEAGNNKDKLVALLNEIDETKRAIKSSLSQLSSEPDEKTAKGRDRQGKIRRMKDKLSFLTEEREIVRVKLGRLKVAGKALKRCEAGTNVDFAHAFMVAAEQILSEEQLNEIEARASEILDSAR